MMHYPNVYHKAQEEIDRIIGRERLPDLTDRGSLPYLEALVMELYRRVTSNPCLHPPLLNIRVFDVGGTLLSP